MTAARTNRVDTSKLNSNSRKLKPGDGPDPQIGSGMNYPAAKLIELFEPDDWEGFTEEWALTQEKTYKEVMRWLFSTLPRDR